MLIANAATGVSAIADRIRTFAAQSTYDGRHLLYPGGTEPDYQWKLTEEFRRDYMCLRYAAAAILHPSRICEIGVCTGVAALAMLAGARRTHGDAHYVGIDLLAEDDARGIHFIDHTRQLLSRLGYDHEIIIADSQQLTSLPGQFDLVHVDGCHQRAATAHDVELAWNATFPSGYILIDDCNNHSVAAGVFDALDRLAPCDLDWTFFDSLNGTILIARQGKPR